MLGLNLSATGHTQKKGGARNQVAEGYVVLDMVGASAYNFPHRVRPIENGRKQLIIRNIGLTSIQCGYRLTDDNSNWNGATSYDITIQPGEEYVEDQASTRMIFMRPSTSGQTARAGVYYKLGA